jgi:hypothetical protein
MSNSVIIAPRRAPWCELKLGSQVWAPLGEHGWRPGTITGFGTNRGDHTVVNLHFKNGGSGQRFAAQLYWRTPRLNGKDKPGAEAFSA